MSVTWAQVATVAAALLLVVGAFGIVVPVLPGLLMCLLAVLLWAAVTGTTTAWVCFVVAVAFFVGGVTLQFLLPGRRMKRQGVGLGTLVLAVAGAVAGFFLLPFVGAPVGFVGAIFLVEMARTRERHRAWARTRLALGAVLQSMGIELGAAFGMAVAFGVGVVLSRG